MKQNTSEAAAGFKKKYQPKTTYLNYADVVHLHQKKFNEVLELMEMQKKYSAEDVTPQGKTTYNSIQKKIKKANAQCRKLDQLLTDKINYFRL